jgi:hypothetical protein
MNVREKLRPGAVVTVIRTRSRQDEGTVRAVFDNRFELELAAVENAYEHFSNQSAPAEHRTITIYFEDVVDVRPT